MVWLKALHIVSLIVWGGMLLYIPILFASHAAATGEKGEFRRLRILSRSSFILVSSPAAVIAIATGTILIFVNSVYEGWMFLKLGAVGVLAILHAWTGGLLSRLHDPNFKLTWRRQSLLIVSKVIVVAVILVLVLAKPQLDD